MSDSVESRKDTEHLQELIADATPDGPALEFVGTTEGGNGLYEMNMFDLLVYMRGLKAMKEESDAE